MILALLVTHGNLANGLKDAVEQMLGQQEGFLTLSNSGLAGKDLIEKINQILEEQKHPSTVLFTDIYGGSCWRSSRFVASQNPKVALVTGVNLPMLLTFFTNRNKLDFDQLLAKVVQMGEEGIKSEV
jgi:mannose/fructose/sorbose-specific phosphotransferase system IIA component